MNGIGGLSEVPAESSDKKPGGAVEKARAEAATQA